MKKYYLPTLSTKADAVILANGDFPKHEIPLSILRNNDYIVCCDGAIDKLTPTGIQPKAIVGDCDSLSATNWKKYANIIHQIKEQETNDLTKSVKFCIEKGKKNIIILGATGSREDHTIANISLLADYLEYTTDICMISDYGIFNAIEKNSLFQSIPDQQISIFSLTPTPLTVENLKYPIKNRILTNWWQATLNQSLSDEFSIKVSGKTIIFRIF
jgi:thiamine pyrophosphokinase